MKLKQLESILSGVDTFTNPKIELEQYPTSAHLAACMLYEAESRFGDISGKAICDLGTGTGMLAIAAEAMGSSYTVGVDIDPDALEIAHENVCGFEVDIDLVQHDVFNWKPAAPIRFDTVLTNPPFGTRDSGADVRFLETAFQIANGAVYSLHKSSTREFLLQKGREWGADATVIAEMRFDIPAMYKFHKSKSKDIQVDLLRFDLSKRSRKSQKAGGAAVEKHDDDNNSEEEED